MCEKIDWDAYEKETREELIKRELQRIEQIRQQKEEEKRQCIVLSVIGFILVLILLLLG